MVTLNMRKERRVLSLVAAQETPTTFPRRHVILKAASETQACPQEARGLITGITVFTHRQKHPELIGDDFCEGPDLLKALYLIY